MPQTILIILAIIIIALLLTKKGRALLARVFGSAPKNLEAEKVGEKQGNCKNVVIK